jgi:ribosome-associated toxin RatA of RatAB toxin-antitoxin module
MNRKTINKLYYVGYPLLRGIAYNLLESAVEKFARNSVYTSEIILPAPPAEVMKLFLEFENYGKYLPLIEKITVLERTAKSARLAWTINLEDAVVQWEDVVAMPNGAPKLLFTSVSGDFDKYVRQFEFKREGNETRLCSTIDLVFNLGLMNKVVGNIIKEKIARVNDDLLLGVKKMIQQQGA